MKTFRRTLMASLFIVSGILVIVFGLAYYLSPITRLELYGTKLEHMVGFNGPVNYLIGWHSQSHSWSEVNGHMDTPLGDDSTDEISTIRVERLPGTPTEIKLIFRPVEWVRSIKDKSGFISQTIPLNHPSIAPVTLLLDKQGTLLERSAGSVWRLEGAVQFMIPKFPKGSMKRGSRWQEHLEWTETSDGWKFGWKADLQWTVQGFKTCYGDPCAQLAYEATIQPSLLQEVFWSQGADRDIHFTGQAHGEALYNIKQKFLISNTLDYQGKIAIHVHNLKEIPESLRIGALPVANEGDIVLQIENKIDVRLP